MDVHIRDPRKVATGRNLVIFNAKRQRLIGTVIGSAVVSLVFFQYLFKVHVECTYVAEEHTTYVQAFELLGLLPVSKRQGSYDSPIACVDGWVPDDEAEKLLQFLERL